MKKITSIGTTITLLIFLTSSAEAWNAKIYEKEVTMDSYMFSDPDPIPHVTRIYPYFRFDGYTNSVEKRQWKFVVLENDYIKLFVAPEVGGKVWGAIEKSTGKEFLYYNHVAKFRDVAMRGAWSSGGLEYNFGDIGHIPTCATPVDYTMRKNSDGSVSCFVGAFDQPSGSRWNVEIRLEPDKAYFTTHTFWINESGVRCSYYHWMNAAAKANGDLEFLYPGTHRIGHGGEVGSWPQEEGKEISLYKDNNFGGYKSYHIIGSYANTFGGYWHKDNFGFGHYAEYDEKPGRKAWIWGLSREGLIWEKLLTDSDGPYVEYQAGKLFNQAAHSSGFTPFKHREFLPYDVDEAKEYWFPLNNTKGMKSSTPYAAINWVEEERDVRLIIEPLQFLSGTLKIVGKEGLYKEVSLDRSPLENLECVVSKENFNQGIKILWDQKILFSNENTQLERPNISPQIDYSTLYGKYSQALELEKQRMYPEAYKLYESVLDEDPNYMPALCRMGVGCYTQGNYTLAIEYFKKALAIDTYCDEANYYYGLSCQAIGKSLEAKAALSLASSSVAYRSSSFTTLGTIALKEKRYDDAIQCVEKALVYNQHNVYARCVEAIAYRKKRMFEESNRILNRVLELDPLNHLAMFEKVLLEKEPMDFFNKGISNELPYESYLWIADKYLSMGMRIEALNVLSQSPKSVLTEIWLSQLDRQNQEKHIEYVLSQSIEGVAPHRLRTLCYLDKQSSISDHWRYNYWKGLVYWKNGDLKKAGDLFDACGNRPDSYVYYLSISKFWGPLSEKGERAIHRAYTLAPDQWRCVLEQCKVWNNEGEASKSIPILKKWVSKLPENSYLGLCYVQSLNLSNRSKDALRFMSKYEVLPSEGSKEWSTIYKESNLKLALEAVQKSQFDDAIHYAEASKKYPEHLGVGKPYNPDYRLPDYIEGVCYDRMNQNSKARECYQEVVNWKGDENFMYGAALILNAWALDKIDLGESTGKQFLEKAKLNHSNIYTQWCLLAYNKDKYLSEETDKVKTISKPLPYDTRYIDSDFGIIALWINSKVL